MKIVMNKTKAVLNYLQENGSITSWEAIVNFSATRLGAIIYNLKDKGYNIESKPEISLDRFGNEVRFVRYIYKGGVNESK